MEAAESDPESEATSSLLQTFLQDAFAASCEGVMVKALDKDAGYAASKRSDSWLKVRRSFVHKWKYRGIRRRLGLVSGLNLTLGLNTTWPSGPTRQSSGIKPSEHIEIVFEGSAFRALWLSRSHSSHAGCLFRPKSELLGDERRPWLPLCR